MDSQYYLVSVPPESASLNSLWFYEQFLRFYLVCKSGAGSVSGSSSCSRKGGFIEGVLCELHLEGQGGICQLE